MTAYRIHLHAPEVVRKAITDRARAEGRGLTTSEAIEVLNRLSPARVGTGDVGCLHGDFGAPCGVCGDVSDVLCDFPVGDGKTCDASLCEHCTSEVAPNVHYCPGHRAEFEAFRDAGGVKDKLENLVPFARERKRPRNPG